MTGEITKVGYVVIYAGERISINDFGFKKIETRNHGNLLALEYAKNRLDKVIAELKIEILRSKKNG